MAFTNDTKPSTTYSNDIEFPGTGGVFIGFPFALTYASDAVDYSNDSKPTVNQSFNINSGTQFLNAANNSAFQITGDLTLETWYRPGNQPANGETFSLVSKYNATGDQRSYYLAFTRPGGGGTRQMTLSISSDGITDVTKSVNAASTNNIFTHMAAAYSASAGTVQFYKDGSAMGALQTGLPTSIFNSTADLQIAGLSGANGLFVGFFDEIRVWNTTRSAAEISANYNVELTGTETGLKAYYKANGTFRDSTSNANHLTNNGQIAFSNTVPFTATAYTNDDEGD